MRSRVWLKIDGGRVSVPEAARRLGVSRQTIYIRLRAGVPREALLAKAYGGERAPKVKLTAARPRPMLTIRERVREAGSPVRAAFQGDLTAEEFLSADTKYGDESW